LHRAAFSKELEQFEFYNTEVAAFLGLGPGVKAFHGTVEQENAMKV
jgi:hypothetical protein